MASERQIVKRSSKTQSRSKPRKPEKLATDLKCQAILALPSKQIRKLPSKHRFEFVRCLTSETSFYKLWIHYASNVYPNDLLNKSTSITVSESETSEDSFDRSPSQPGLDLTETSINSLQAIQAEFATIEFDEIVDDWMLSADSIPAFCIAGEKQLTLAQECEIRYAFFRYACTIDKAYLEYAFNIAYQASPTATRLAVQEIITRILQIGHDLLPRFDADRQAYVSTTNDKNAYKCLALIYDIHCQLMTDPGQLSPADNPLAHYNELVKPVHRLSAEQLYDFCTMLVLQKDIKHIPRIKIKLYRTMVMLGETMINTAEVNHKAVLTTAKSCHNFILGCLESAHNKVAIDATDRLEQALPVIEQGVAKAIGASDQVALEEILRQIQKEAADYHKPDSTYGLILNEEAVTFDLTIRETTETMREESSQGQQHRLETIPEENKDERTATSALGSLSSSNSFG